ncbi:MAG: hypothetical protein KDA53_18385 [Hyphomonas sp.]|nr:hypothetical protein [Hyphomonas sp.]
MTRRRIPALLASTFLAISVAAPASADIFGDVRKKAEHAVATVKKETTKAVDTVADVVDDLTAAPEPPKPDFNPIKGGPYEPPPSLDSNPPPPVRSIDDMEAFIDSVQTDVCPTRDQGRAPMPTVNSGQRLALAGCRVVTDTAGDVIDLGQLGRKYAGQLADGLKASLSDEEARKDMVERMAEGFEDIEPVTQLISEGFFQTPEGRDAMTAISNGDMPGLIRIVGTTDKLRTALMAAKAAGFETLTIGAEVDGSLMMGAILEGGAAIDIEAALNSRIGQSTFYVTVTGTAGAAGSVDGGVGVGVWRAAAPNVAGPAWGGMAAIPTGSAAVGGGVWFDQDESANEGAGNFIGLTVGGSVGLGFDVAKLARAATATGSFNELTNAPTLLARLYTAAKM